MKLNVLVNKNILTVMGVSLLSMACSSNIDANSSNKAIDDPQSQEATGKVVDKKETAEGLVETLQKNLKESGVETKIISVTPTQIEGLYWVTAEGVPPFFSDEEGRHIFQGSMIEIGNGKPIDISAKLNAKIAKKELANIDTKDMVIYPAKDEKKAHVYVFTDASCGYCQKFHQEIAQVNEQGIEVRYLAWPRSDEATPILEAVWCSDDRQKAMDMAKSGQMPTAEACDNPVKDQVALGMRLGVSGTPAIFTEEGVKIGGYVPARDIAKAIGLE